MSIKHFYKMLVGYIATIYWEHYVYNIFVTFFSTSKNMLDQAHFNNIRKTSLLFKKRSYVVLLTSLHYNCILCNGIYYQVFQPYFHDNNYVSTEISFKLGITQNFLSWLYNINKTSVKQWKQNLIKNILKSSSKHSNNLWNILTMLIKHFYKMLVGHIATIYWECYVYNIFVTFFQHQKIRQINRIFITSGKHLCFSRNVFMLFY